MRLLAWNRIEWSALLSVVISRTRTAIGLAFMASMKTVRCLCDPMGMLPGDRVRGSLIRWRRYVRRLTRFCAGAVFVELESRFYPRLSNWNWDDPLAAKLSRTRSHTALPDRAPVDDRHSSSPRASAQPRPAMCHRRYRNLPSAYWRGGDFFQAYDPAGNTSAVVLCSSGPSASEPCSEEARWSSLND